jgi:hypothetical protein
MYDRYISTKVKPLFLKKKVNLVEGHDIWCRASPGFQATTHSFTLHACMLLANLWMLSSFGGGTWHSQIESKKPLDGVICKIIEIQIYQNLENISFMKLDSKERFD